jgi:hypothetical protein
MGDSVMGVFSRRSAQSDLWLPNYGNRSDGALTWTSITVAKQVYQCTDMTLPNGVTVTLSQSYIPHIWRIQGALIVDGLVAGAGKGHPGGAGGAVGAPGSGPGRGYHGGAGTDNNGGGGGGGGGHAAAGGNGGVYRTVTPSGSGGRLYDALGSILSQVYGEWCAGSGGGGGGGYAGGTGGNGGPGGPGWVAICRLFRLGATGVINLNGGNGANGSNPNGGGGGAGSGGFGLVIADYIELPASGTPITALGGTPGTGYSNNGGTASPGRIYLVALRGISPSDAASRCNPAATVIDLASLPIALG